MKKTWTMSIISWLHCSWRTCDGKRSQRSLHPAPCYLRQLHHTIPLVIWRSFIIKLVRLLLATHSSCWRLFLSFPPLLAANLLPAFKQNLLNRIRFCLLSECTILIQLGEEAEGSGASLHFFLFHKSMETLRRCRKLTAWMKGRTQPSIHTFPSLYAWRAGSATAATELLHSSLFFKGHFFIDRALYSGRDLPRDN